ncbi:GGDEF domain-containing protein [Oleiagrimonas sp. C23AA]|uniref:GGDEF domain-containing protein n=1 Tax=Oleiagrimonas sp. C23AA TaxID=2719047 RepID=UPI00141E5C62|nr:GGDEF domain-containing protein [Oleiagrimonas sp. C23AA]NII11308.1 GGDEF domain-containing protein [Oleiagrimonas sp. C23AA]
MLMDLGTVAALGALQALVMAPVVVLATRRYTGVAGRGLKLWGMVLLLQAAAWVMAAGRGHISGWLSIVLANGLLLASYVLTVRAMRLILARPSHTILCSALALVSWLALTWFAVADPIYGARVALALLPTLFYAGMLLWPMRHALRRGGSSAQRVMILVLLGSAITTLWRLGELAFSHHAPTALMVSTPGNTAGIVYASIEPVFASLAFFMLYAESVEQRLARLARIDPLTDVYNRLALLELGRPLFASALRHGRSFAVMMIDVDHFKRINAAFGHGGGDQVLVESVRYMRQALRAEDIFGRVGGEEFLVLLPDTTLHEAMASAERVRAVVARTPVPLHERQLPISVSIGVAEMEPGDRELTRIIERADMALYTAKLEGRNRVSCEISNAARRHAAAHPAIDDALGNSHDQA